MAITITGENVLLEGDKYDALCNRAAQATKYEKVVALGGERPPKQIEIAARLRRLADEMDDISVCMDYYGGLAAWSQHGREIAGAGKIARQWADEIEAANGTKLSGARDE